MKSSWLRLVALLLFAVGFRALSAQTGLGSDRVTFYSEPHFKGDALTLEAGAAVESLDTLRRDNARRWTFGISSVRVEGSAKAFVYSGPYFAGDRLEISRDIADLYGENRGQSGTTWDRAIASVAIAGQRSIPPSSTTVYRPGGGPNYVVAQPARPQMAQVERRVIYNQRTADLVIERAYRDVLGRVADPAGVQHYRQKLMREGWTERQVIEDLKGSREARAITPDEAITQLYREVLGREPDATGLNHYRKLWRQGWTQGQIRDDLRRSVESRDVSIRNAITRAYRELLGREPDAAGYANYEKLMREKGMTERLLRQTLMAGEEYRQRQRGN
jgi:hypothetical protein